ncbi:MAG: TonB-dependent receptor [Acidobacteria bacterium]|nr:TonB-dependent receptor [Acidobacteriota bacterium]
MKRVIFFIIMMLTVASSSLLFALTEVGTMEVTVWSTESKPIPGVKIEIESPNMIGKRMKLTSTEGKAIFLNLPVGTYSILAELEGFKIKETKNLVINPGKKTDMMLVLETGGSEVITVMSEPEIVDTSNSAIESKFNFDQYLNYLPTGRHYTSIASTSSGVEPGNNPSVLGAGREANAYLVDGVSTTDPRSKAWGTQFNMDIVDQMILHKTGVDAEYGHFMGSISNIITKSGANSIHGIARLEMYRKSWNDITYANPEIDTDDAQVGDSEDQWNFSGGGPLIEDFLWWYIGYTSRESLTDWQRRTDPMNPTSRVSAVRAYVGHFFSIKGTAQLGPNVRISGFYKEDPIENGNVLSWVWNMFNMAIMPDADVSQRQGGDALMFNGSWIINDSLFIEARIIDDNEVFDYGAQEASPDGYWTKSYDDRTNYFSIDGWIWGSVMDDYKSERNQNTYAAAINYLVDTDSLGSHDMKLGVEFMDQWSVLQQTDYPGGEYILTGRAGRVGFDNVTWLQRTLVIGDRLPAAETHIGYWTAYLQDSIALNDSLTINLGLRTDIASGENNQGTTIFETDLLSALAPRVGIAYDLKGSVLRASYSRYFDMFSLYILDWFNVYDSPELWQLFVATNQWDGHYGWTKSLEWYEGSSESLHSIDSDLKPQYAEEVSLGIDIPLASDMRVSLSGVWRTYHNLVIAQDMDDDNYYNIENLVTDAYGTKWKEYLGVIVEFNKMALNDHLFLNASFTYGLNEGLDKSNVETGGYGGYSAQRYDNADEWWHEMPYPSIYLKMQSVYSIPSGWYLGLTGSWNNGELISSYALKGEKVNWGYMYDYVNGFGDLGRIGDAFLVDLQIGKESVIELPFDVPLTDSQFMFGVYFNIYNLFNDQSAIEIDPNINSYDYLSETDWRAGRSYRLGIRLEI